MIKDLNSHKIKLMKNYVLLFIVGLVLTSCGTKIAYTDAIRDEFGLESEQMVKKVQFYTSATIILEKNKESGNQGTDSDGKLVTSSNKEQDRIIIPIGTKCVFDAYGPNGELVLRFEVGAGKVITFAQRPGTTSGKYYLVADWNSGRSGGVLKYGNETYTATTTSGTAYLEVIRKRLQKTKRKDRVVHGMKV
ncbi:MAG: hypothetical protein A3D92_05320 [Bacteroidetes bacterium RIFCSPHIGHO2_02_FULL_44_7]|nr:MAG: hypothetical protein A3D92_05320 [Bacteroidetes bacterium RIFCSPHIGHO2_02_FULL_44_7]